MYSYTNINRPTTLYGGVGASLATNKFVPSFPFILSRPTVTAATSFANLTVRNRLLNNEANWNTNNMYGGGKRKTRKSKTAFKKTRKSSSRV